MPTCKFVALAKMFLDFPPTYQSGNQVILQEISVKQAFISSEKISKSKCYCVNFTQTLNTQ